MNRTTLLYRGEGDDPKESLLPSDLQVIELIAKGRERNDVAAVLEINRTEVNRRLAKAFRLTGTNNSTHLVTRLANLGLGEYIGAGEATTKAAEQARQTAFLDAAEYLRNQRLKTPLGDVEEHTNDVILSLAKALEERA